MGRQRLEADTQGGGLSVDQLSARAESPVAHRDLVPKLAVVALIAFGALVYWLFV